MKLVRRFFSVVVFALFSLTTSIPAGAQAAQTDARAQVIEPEQAAPEPMPYSEVTYPEIVRLRSAEGDVRIERGEKKDSGWEDAVSGLPLLSGFGLVTGPNGRAEIELEDASTVYLDSNSVLVLNDMHTSAGIPYTGVTLLSGTVALHLRPDVSGDLFVLQTATDNIEVVYPHRADFRISSYANAMAVTPLESTAQMVTGGAEEPVTAGETAYYAHGARLHFAVASPEGVEQAASTQNSGIVGVSATLPGHSADASAKAGSSTQEDFAEFDSWVAGRVYARKTTMTEVMKESGLTEPIPGLDDLAGKGRFFDCAPYGTCWEPPAMGARQQSANSGASPAAVKTGQPAPASAGAQGNTQTGTPTPGAPATGTGTPAQVPAQVSQTASYGSYTMPFESMADFFPCLPDSMLYELGMYPYAGMIPAEYEAGALYGMGYAPFAAPWEWAVCHDGSWLYRNHRYVWVVGHRRWHRPPIRWVHTRQGAGFVPLHPRDLKDKLPINRRQGMYVLDGKLNGKPGARLERVAMMPGDTPQLLKDPPKQYRNWYFAPLRTAVDPRIEAQRVSFGPHTETRVTAARDVNLSFDHKSRAFMMDHAVTTGGRTRMVSELVTNSLGGRAGGSSGGVRGFLGGSAGRSGGSSSGSFSGGASRASGASSGGGARGGGSSGGGGGFSGGGGSHGGGGGGGAPSGGAGPHH